MNDTFNLKRFAWLLKKSILERPALMLGLLAVTLAITLLTYSIVQSIAGINRAQISAFVLGFVTGGSFMASSVFGYFSSTASGSSFLLIPASHFEKWLCGILITGVLFILIYLGFYRLIDIFFVNSYRNGLDPARADYQLLYSGIELFSFDNEIAKIVYTVFFNLAGAMLVGSLYFNKVSYIKVALVICTLTIVTYFLNLSIAMAFFDHIDVAIPFKVIFLKVGKGVGIINQPDLMARAINITISYVIPAILWLTAYIRLKEKEI
ncbi:hypothetical protein RYH73_16500 [Olivibacter sp. CPCC 100613]|uniref:hypothetical protein n=1 Tax=Olivibacter sp. CPCC 100613 TaxID=3079931 RepID=UPI002FF86C45